MKKCLRIRKSYYIYIILSFRNSHFIEEQERGRGWGRCKCKRKSRSCSETLTGNYVRHVTQWIPSQELATAQRQSNRHTDQLAPQIHLHRRAAIDAAAHFPVYSNGFTLWFTMSEGSGGAGAAATCGMKFKLKPSLNPSPARASIAQARVENEK